MYNTGLSFDVDKSLFFIINELTAMGEKRGDCINMNCINAKLTKWQWICLDVGMWYKFLHSGHPSYFGPLLPTRCGRYSTRYNHPDKRFLEVPQFCPSVHKSKNHFGHSFAFDAPTVWNHLPNEVRSAPTLTCFRKRLKSYLFHKAFPP